ncbi:hypothetical protein HRbin30_02682 [bacterium HR30]|nr:hypothetical protein HRbin30_02682 [bacterium HR30]
MMDGTASVQARRNPGGGGNVQLEPRCVRLVLLFFLFGVVLSAALVPRVGWTGTVTCVRVVQEAGRISRQNKGRVPAVGELARHVGAPPAFVERCMHTFGRRVRREGAESREAAEVLIEQLEEDEVEESFPEDVEEPGAVERPKREPKPRYLSIRPTPGAAEGAELLPGEWERYQEDLRREREP